MGGTSGNKGPRRPEGGAAAPQGREARLKAALKANMARRKAQARARSGAADAADDPDPETDGQQQDG
jgi:hypothetical protein